jgi:hypothetical protein
MVYIIIIRNTNDFVVKQKVQLHSLILSSKIKNTLDSNNIKLRTTN